MGPVIEVRGLVHSYRGPAGDELAVLRGVNLEVEPGAFVALLGPSGAGKSTLLAILGGLERAQSGLVRVGGQDLRAAGAGALAAHRRRTVGFVFQHFGLMEALTARENVELALIFGGTPVGRRAQRARELLDQVGLTARMDHLPGQLSGGEQQRVGIARAVANRPRVLLADEPTGNLDRRTGEYILDLLEMVRREAGCAIVMVTHEERAAARADGSLLLDQGRVSIAA